mmetsp:Transcript_37725/g.99812  ORF Transcript_37725/g.99812 Transcript_37725/m.99812 type:complete len:258 (+) Transcript_37725:273-1046(+)
MVQVLLELAEVDVVIILHLGPEVVVLVPPERGRLYPAAASAAASGRRRFGEILRVACILAEVLLLLRGEVERPVVAPIRRPVDHQPDHEEDVRAGNPGHVHHLAHGAHRAERGDRGCVGLAVHDRADRADVPRHARAVPDLLEHDEVVVHRAEGMGRRKRGPLREVGDDADNGQDAQLQRREGAHVVLVGLDEAEGEGQGADQEADRHDAVDGESGLARGFQRDRRDVHEAHDPNLEHHDGLGIQDGDLSAVGNAGT